MRATPLARQAPAVLGPIAGEAMGITLPHEHLLIDIEVMFKEPADGSERGLAEAPTTDVAGCVNRWTLFEEM